ncbi:hypothetical protein [Leptolyngbya sp. NIES-2104]|uniref:hypothetical protein n=1 Tax=Leptolyngbya sp. NIES-2104 TaxID=1552121 RepID=UPI000A72FB79|nr:hypothetical protein [Leptolyngbya sp. NIES-2104]
MTHFLMSSTHSASSDTRFDCSRIDQVIHATVCHYHPMPDRACAWYALLGTLLLRRLSPKSCYSFYAGTFEICTSPDPTEAGVWYALCFDAHQPLIPDQEFHCWIAHPDPAQRIYSEVIDFSARHLETRAREFGIPWNRDPVPDFIWTDVAGLEQLKVRQLRPIVDLTDRITRTLLQEPAFRRAWQSLATTLNSL